MTQPEEQELGGDRSAAAREGIRIAARRTGNSGDVLSFNLPTAMSRAIPPGSHWFEASFTTTGIHLTYLGPRQAEPRRRNTPVEIPAWVISSEASR